MNLSAKKGFTLIEAMLAVTIVALIVAPIFVLEDTLFNAVSRTAKQFHRFLFAQNFMMQARMEQKPGSTNFSLERREENPATILKYTLDKLPGNSSLKAVKNLYVEKVEAKGQEKTSPTVTLLSFQFRPALGGAQ